MCYNGVNYGNSIDMHTLIYWDMLFCFYTGKDSNIRRINHKR